MKKVHSYLFCLFCYLVRFLLAVRYKIEVTGLEEVLTLKKQKNGILFLPNHPAEVDPIMIIAILGPNFFPRSVVIEHFYKGFVLERIMRFCRARPIPSLDTGYGIWKKKALRDEMRLIRKELSLGENFLIYPAGQLKRKGEERLGGASLVYDLCKERKGASAVLIRTTGLWGSSFSTFQTGRTPPLGKMFFNGVKAIIKNGIFFVPRRKVLIECAVTRDLPVEGDKIEFNQFLESWYNKRPDPLTLVPYLFWNKKSFAPPMQKKEAERQPPVDPAIQKVVVEEISLLSKTPPENIHAESHLSFDLGLDSLNIAEICTFLDKRYGIAASHPENLKTVQDICLLIEGKKQESLAMKQERESFPKEWFFVENRKPLAFESKQVVPELFLQSCQKRRSSIACADKQAGVFSYQKLQMVVLLLAEEFKKFPGERVAILLPSATLTYASILATLIAGKVPVMLNWTAGKQSLDHAHDIGGFQVCVTSKRFLDKIALEELGKVEDTLCFLEDLRKGISWQKKLKGAIRSLYSIKRLHKVFGWNQDPTQAAVLLFTSGTESLPKAVPLSHDNLIANQKAVLCNSGLTEKESLYGSLPPFHSFGFSLTGLFPLLCGLKVFYAPDPTDSHTMASDLERSKISVLCLAPSFYRLLFLVATPRQLEHLRLVVSGAEKPMPDVLSFVKEHLPNACWLEGYGITECSPVVSLQSPGKVNAGVGPVVPGTEVCFIDPMTLEKLSPGEQGEICIAGPSVFSGYLGGDIDPFITIDGKKWYRSGDLGYLDKEGNLHITDRLKRTVKIGGEMISLGSIEQALYAEISTSDQEGPAFAVMGKSGDKQKLVLFTTQDVDLLQINDILRSKGFARIAKISEIIQLEKIPLTGTGKVHYRELNQLLG
jgi:long-chain-fatty-acid--[acyl-carrier-protein] ligase